MTDQSGRIVKKLWSYCQVLRDDGLSYQDYLEQLTFLLSTTASGGGRGRFSAQQPNKPMNLPVTFGARRLSGRR